MQINSIGQSSVLPFNRGFLDPASLLALLAEGGEGSSAWWTKLLSLVVREQRLQYLPLDGRSLNRVCAGWLALLKSVMGLWVRLAVYVVQWWSGATLSVADAECGLSGS